MCALLGLSDLAVVRGVLHSGEVSTNSGGLVRWPAKLILPLGFALVLLQGFSNHQCVAALKLIRAQHAYEKPLQ